MAPMDPREAPGGKSAQEVQEEIAFLRQKCSSLMMRGDYAECIKAIEGNLDLLYHQERMPENFFAMLRNHQRCYPALNKSQPYEEYLPKLLQRHGIPIVFAKMMRSGGKAMLWTGEYFRESAISCKNSGDYEEALGYCDLALKIEPFGSNLYLLKGWILEDMGRAEQAVEQYRQALEFNRTNYQASNSLARYYLEKDPQKALDYVQEAMEAHPDEASFYATRSAIYLKLGERQAALGDYDIAMSLDPLNAEYPYQKAELLEAEGLIEPAINLYQQALESNGRHIPTLMKLAQLCAEKQPDLALEYIATVLSREPNNRQAQMTRARLCWRTGDTTGALRQYYRILDEEPENLEVLDSVANILVEEDPLRAMEYYEKAVKLSPDTARYHLGKGRAHQLAGDREEAIAEYKSAHSLDKKSDRACARLGDMFVEENPQQALDYYAKASSLAPRKPEYHAAQGELLLEMPGRIEEALRQYQTASELDPADAVLHCRLALALHRAGKRASAERHFALALHINPNQPEAHHGLASILMDTQPHVALVHMNRAIHLDPVNGLYYYAKAKVLDEMDRQGVQLEKLQEALALEEKQEGSESKAEIETLMKGDVLHVALFYINRAIELAPDSTTAICLRAHLLGKVGQKAKAINQYELLLEKDPQNHEALYGLGTVLAASQPKKALEHMDKAIRLAPAVAQYHFGKAALLAKDPDRYEEAVESYGMAGELDHNNWEAQLERGKLLEEHGNTGEAAACYRKALLIHRECLYAAARMGDLLAHRKPHAALSYVEHAIGLDPQNPSFRVFKADLLYRIGESSAAEREMAVALELGEWSGEILFQLAAKLWEYRPQKALEYALAAAEREGAGEACFALCGHIYQTLGDAAKAREYYQRAAELAPAFHEARERLARLLYEQKDPYCPDAVEAALEQKQDCAACHDLRARLRDELLEDLQGALEDAQEAVRLEPDQPAYREKLVDLLRRKRSLLRYYGEKRRLEKLLRRLKAEQQQEDDTEEIHFDDQESQTGSPLFDDVI